jgi:hypothetical protein
MYNKSMFYTFKCICPYFDQRIFNCDKEAAFKTNSYAYLKLLKSESSLVKTGIEFRLLRKMYEIIEIWQTE